MKGSVAGMGEDMHYAINMLVRKRIKTDVFMIVNFPLDDIQKAFQTLLQRKEDFKT